MKTVRDIRVERGITQKKMADELGISRQTYALYEANPGQMTIEIARKVCFLLGMPYNDIFFAPKAS